MSDRLKLGVVLIVESVLMCHHKKRSIDIFHLEIVDDIDAFNSYPWGHRCFTDTLRHFRKGYSMLRWGRPERKYDAYGMPLALQIWMYETVPVLAGRYARRVETCCLRIFQWRAQDKLLTKQISALLDDPEVLKNGVHLSSNLSCMMGCPVSDRIVFVNRVKCQTLTNNWGKSYSHVASSLSPNICKELHLLLISAKKNIPWKVLYQTTSICTGEHQMFKFKIARFYPRRHPYF